VVSSPSLDPTCHSQRFLGLAVPMGGGGLVCFVRIWLRRRVGGSTVGSVGPSVPRAVTRGHLRRLVTLSLALVVVGACSSSSAVPTSTESSRTAPLPTSPATSVATTNPKPTPTTSTTTTIDQRALAERRVRTAVDATVRAFSDCLQVLPKCDVNTLTATRRGELLKLNTERITEWNAAGYAVRDREQFRYVIESVALDSSATKAIVAMCVADGSKLVMPGAGPGGADVVVDGTYVSGRESWDVRLDDDGVWRTYAAPAVGATESRDVCPRA
jgi:hypothetical protein